MSGVESQAPRRDRRRRTCTAAVRLGVDLTTRADRSRRGRTS